MTKKTLGILALSAATFAAGALLAQSGASKTAAPAPAPAAQKQQKIIQVSALNTAEEYQQFQNNVQLMQAWRQQVVEANTAYEKEKDAAKKKELKAKLDDMLAKLNENNQKMLKAYGFSLERNYTLVIDKARVFMLVTDEEAAAYEKAQKEQAAKAEKDAAKKK